MLRTTALIFLLLCGGCRQNPSVGGESLYCDGGGECPDGMRCVNGTCVQNTPPRVAPLSAREIIVGESFTVSATATDPDGDEIHLSWSQSDGPVALIASGESMSGPTLKFDTPLAGTNAVDNLGAFVFDVVANDGFDDSVVQQLTVVLANTPPEISPLPRQFSVRDEEVTLILDASDADSERLLQTITITWKLIEAPGLISGEEMEGNTMVFTPTQLGLHAFEVWANDTVEDGERLRVELVVQPAEDVIYVTDAVDTPAATCGSFIAPCTTITDGLAAARTAGIDTLMVAANVARGFYAECLDLTGDEQLIGALDPDSWQEEPDLLRASTRIICSAGSAHELHGTTHLRNVTLSSDTREGEFGITLVINGGAPTIDNVDVEAPACGPDCISVGIAIVESNAVLTGVEVRVTQTGFDILGAFIGIYVWRGAPTITGTAQPRATRDDERGGVALNSPVNNFATGMTLVRTQAIIETLVIEGGLGHGISAISVAGGEPSGTGPTIRNNVIELIGFGSFNLLGITVEGCASNDGTCSCANSLNTCTDPVIPVRYDPAVLLAGNEITLQSAAGELGQVPCIGFGVKINSEAAGQELTDNTVTIVGAFNLAWGIARMGDPSTTAPRDRIANNTISIDDGHSDDFCTAFGLGGDSGLDSALLGLLYEGAGDIEGNTVTVGAHEENAIGLALLVANKTTVTDNVIMAGASTRGLVGKEATGALVGATIVGAEPSILARNKISVAGGAIESRGLWLADFGDGCACSELGICTAGLPCGLEWIVENNAVYGGRTRHSVGLWTIAPESSEWPRFVHNTIHGGGDPDEA